MGELAVLDEEELLFPAGEQGNTFDADVDNQPVQDLALNEDNIFQADECDAFDSDVDDEPTAQSILMAKVVYIMADVNAPIEQAPAVTPPTRTDEQILPRIRWVPIGKSNCYLDAEKSQSNPIYKIAVDILKHTNFFRAFTASSTIPAIYIQQFWDTICYDRTDGGYKCQLDEQWFNLTKDTLRDALQITPVNNNKAFSSPPTQDTLINFVNGLGYPKEVKHLSNVVTNDMFQPWTELTTIINLCLTGKTSGFERPRALVLQILWGVINRAHIDYCRGVKRCGKNSLISSNYIHFFRRERGGTKRIWHNILRERRKPLSL
ncbi:hypothetical protein Tco_1126031 [Tanacetum coccineum]